MNLIKLKPHTTVKDNINTFFGLNMLERTDDGELSGDENTSDSLYPFLTVGGEKMKLKSFYGTVRGLHAKDKLCAVVSVTEGDSAAARLYYGGEETSLVLTDGEKQLVSMGTKIIIFPDKKYYDTYNGECGSLEAFFTSTEGVNVRYSLTRTDCTDYSADISPTAPASPSDSAMWYDTSSSPAVLKVYSEANGTWTAVDSVYVKISYEGIGEHFSEGDGVEISGSVCDSLNGVSVIVAKDKDFIVVAGALGTTLTQSTPLSVSRRVPQIDFITECDNRLWACRFGLNNNGDFVNEIYSSKLGDPFNWECFEGISTDSYMASVGTDGAFTGAVSYLGSVLFFKESCVHKVFGTKPANFQITSNSIRGVEKGSHGSLCIIDEILYYKNQSGIMAYDGALPYCISTKLGRCTMKNVICGRGTYYLYVSFIDEQGTRQLYTYGTQRGIWHRRSPENVSDFAFYEGVCVYSVGKELYATELKNNDGEHLAKLFGCDNIMICPDRWRFETSELAFKDGSNCYVTRLHLKMKVSRGARVKIRLKCGELPYVSVGSVKAATDRVFTIPVITGRCSSLKLELSGEGNAVVYSIGRTLETAPDGKGEVF